MRLIIAVLSAIIGCQATPPTYDRIEVDARSTQVWTAGCTDYSCKISVNQVVPNGPLFFNVLWCCPFLDRAFGSTTLRGKSGNDPWISTSTDYSCGSTTTFLASPLFTSIDVSMRTGTRPEVASQCNLVR